MITLACELSAAQRRVLDRYTVLLGSLVPLHDKVSMVFERRRRSGHRPSWIAYDSRLNQAVFDERYLKALWERIESVRKPTRILVEELAKFAQESLELTSRTSRNHPLDQVAVEVFSLSRSAIWSARPPTSVRQLMHGLGSLFFDLGGHYDPIKFKLLGMQEFSFGLQAIFTRAMGFPSCNCHQQPSAGQELFKEIGTTPVWDITYSASDPVIKAREYESDVTKLFKDFVLLSTQMSVFVEELKRRTDDARSDLLETTDMSTLGRLNFKLGTVQEGAEELLRMLEHLEAWLRKEKRPM